MKLIDYKEVAHSIPEIWTTEEEIHLKVPQIFIKLVLDTAQTIGLNLTKDDKLRDLTNLLSKLTGVDVEIVEQELMEVAVILSKIEVFEIKFPEIVSSLPLSESNSPIYPSVILASILNVTNEKALNLAHGMFAYYSQFFENSVDSIN